MIREKVQGKDSTLPVNVRVREDLPRVLATYPVNSSDKPSITSYTKASKECRWKPMGMNNLKEIKKVVVSYDLHSPFVKGIVKTLASNNKTTPK